MTRLGRFSEMTRSSRSGWHRAIVLAAEIAACLLAQVAPAGVTVVEDDDDVSMPRVTYHMTVTPAGESVPAMKHRLLPRRIELKGGNAAPYYRRSLQSLADGRRRLDEEFDDDNPLSGWARLTLPLEELPEDDVRRILAMYDDCMAALATAGGQRECDWELGYEDVRGDLALNFDLREMQQCRDLMRMLAVRTRLAVAEGRYDDALAFARMNVKLSRDVANERLLLCGLIGNTGIGLVNDNLIDLIAAPGSPNLYWALASLPSPLISLQEHTQSDLELGLRLFEVIEKAETADWTHEEWNDRFRNACAELIAVAEDSTALSSDAPETTNRRALGAKFIAPAVGVAGYRHAKARLQEAGFDSARLEAMPVGQVMAIYTARAYQRFADEYEKMWNMPFQDAMDVDTDEIGERFHPLSDFEDREFLPLAGLLIPAVEAGLNSQMRITRDLAALQVIEALRMHVAENEGRWPDSLDDVTCVPVPENPATGEPFEYRLEGDAATLSLPPEDRVIMSRRFVIRIAVEPLP